MQPHLFATERGLLGWHRLRQQVGWVLGSLHLLEGHHFGLNLLPHEVHSPLNVLGLIMKHRIHNKLQGRLGISEDGNRFDFPETKFF